MKKFFGVVVVLLLAVSFLAACGPGAPAEFTLSSVTVSPSAPVVNDTVTIGTTVTNDGEQSGSCDVSLTVGDYTDSTSVTLAGGESTGVSFTYAATTAGSYTATVSTPDDSATESFTVTIKEEEEEEGEGEGEEVALPVWSVGDNWVYECSYVDAEGESYPNVQMNVAMVGEVAAGEEEGVTADSYKLDAEYVPEANRVDATTGSPLTVLSCNIFVDKANMMYLRYYAVIKAYGTLADNADLTWAYAPTPTWPVTSYSFTKHTVDAMHIVDKTDSRQGKVLGIEDVTVPAGTFSCLHIVEYDSASPDTYTYEHWFNADVVGSDVKMIDRETYNGAETRVLTSYSYSGSVS
jgi:hypothetical protein